MAGHDTPGGLPSPHQPPRGRTPLSAHAVPFFPDHPRSAASHGEVASTSALCSIPSMSLPAVRLFASPVRSSDRSITLACTPQTRLKGMRKRAAKLASQMQQARWALQAA